MQERMSSVEFKNKLRKGEFSNNGFNESSKQYRTSITGTKNKFRNTKVIWNGMWRGKSVKIKFDSIKERNRAIELIYHEKNGSIRELEFQKRFLLLPRHKDELSASYTGDFYYYDIKLNRYVIEDTKSEITKKLQDYILRRKMFKIKYPNITFSEV